MRVSSKYQTYLAPALAEAPPAEGAPGAGLGAEEAGVAGLALALPRQEVAGAVAGGAGRARLQGCNSVDILGMSPDLSLIMFGVLRHV